MPDNPQPSKESVEAATIIASEWWNADIESQDQLPKLRDLIAAGIEDAYRKGRESMREEAAREMGYMAGAQMKARTHCEDSSTKEIFLRVAKALDVARDAIRSLPLTEVKR